MKAKALISIVTPFFNEEDSIALFHKRLSRVTYPMSDVAFEFVCVNDGSRDATLDRLIEVARLDSRIRVIDLSRNFGKEAALTAGLDESLGDAVIPMDADMQDPPEVIPSLIARWREGFEVVIAKRADRQEDAFVKRSMADLFYRFHNRISDTEIPENVGDFRLMDRVVVDAIKALPERRRFMKGLFAWVGFKTTTVEYSRAARAVGSSKFTGWKLWNFALEGITGFSTIPLRIWTYVGISLALFAFCYAIFIIVRTVILGVDVPGYPSLLAVSLFLGGIQLIGIGVIGEYVGRIYLESKQRPIYIVRQRIQREGEARSPLNTPTVDA